MQKIHVQDIDVGKNMLGFQIKIRRNGLDYFGTKDIKRA